MHWLVISGRRESRLIDLTSEYPELLIPLSGDVTNSKFQEELVRTAKAAFGSIDLIVAAAGAGAVGPFSELSLNTMRSVFEIDFFAPVELVYKSLPVLRMVTRWLLYYWFDTRSASAALHGGYAAAKQRCMGLPMPCGQSSLLSVLI